MIERNHLGHVIWTPAMVGVIKDGYENGIPARDIAAQISPELNKNHIVGIARRKGFMHESRREYPAAPLPVFAPSGGCQSIDGEPMAYTDNPYSYCGKPVQAHSSYCPKHHAEYYRVETKEQKAKRRAKSLERSRLYR